MTKEDVEILVTVLSLMDPDAREYKLSVISRLDPELYERIQACLDEPK